MADESSDVFEVEAILDYKRLRDGVLYFVKWAGVDETTWEPEANLFGCPELLEQFWAEVEARKRGLQKPEDDGDPRSGSIEFRAVHVVLPQFVIEEEESEEDLETETGGASTDVWKEEEEEEVKEKEKQPVRRRETCKFAEDEEDLRAPEHDMALLGNMRLAMYLKEVGGFDELREGYAGEFDWPTRQACIRAIMKGTDNCLFELVEQMLQEMKMPTFESFLAALVDPQCTYGSADEFFADLSLKMNEVVGFFGPESEISLCVLTILADIERHTVHKKTDEQKKESLNLLKEEVESVIADLPDDLDEFMKQMSDVKVVRKRIPKYRPKLNTQPLTDKNKAALSAAMDGLNDSGPPQEMALYGSLMREVERSGTPVIRAAYNLLGFNSDEICQGTASDLIAKINAFQTLFQHTV